MIDAAWKSRPGLIDSCLEQAAPRPRNQPLRVALELQIDARGVVTAVSARLPASEAALGTCIEGLVKAGLRTARPTHQRPTRARLELVLASGDAGGL
jgi:hypothetical protein